MSADKESVFHVLNCWRLLFTDTPSIDGVAALLKTSDRGTVERYLNEWRNGKVNTKTNDKMMLFNFQGCEVRLVGTADNPEWVARDIADILGITQSGLSKRLTEMPDAWKGMILTHTLGGEQSMLTVKEPGLYDLVFRSRKPIAHQFRLWMFEEVLPAIRRTGSYSVETQPASLPQNDLGGFFTQLDTVNRAIALFTTLGIFEGKVKERIAEMARQAIGL